MPLSTLIMLGITLSPSVDLLSEVEQVAKLVETGYVDAQLGQRMAERLRTNLRRGEYKNIAEGRALAERLTRDLHAIYLDRHLRVEFSPDVIPPEAPNATEPRMPDLKELHAAFAPENFGLTRAEVLAGNVGYLNFRYFAPLPIARDAYLAGLRLVANADALVFDLRECRGSMDPAAVPFVVGHLFERPTLLNRIYWRNQDRTQELWTPANPPGPSLVGKPVYVLTSRRTFSGGEAMAYELQALRRATVVGGQTGGGANPGGTRRASDHFGVWLPYGKVTNPVTGTNWEGVGVTPDVRTAPLLALNEAHKLVLKELTRAAREPRDKDRLQQALREVEEATPATRRVRFELSGFGNAKSASVAGTFNAWTPEQDPLRREGNRWVGEALAPLGRHRYKFVVDGQWHADPKNPRQAGPNLDSVLEVK